MAFSSFQVMCSIILGWIYYLSHDLSVVFKIGLLLLAVYYLSPMFLPGSWKWPGLNIIFNNMWNLDPRAKLFPPKKYGYGWTINLAYPFIASKPILNRLFGLGMVALFIYLIYVTFQLVYLITSGQPIPEELFQTWFP